MANFKEDFENLKNENARLATQVKVLEKQVKALNMRLRLERELASKQEFNPSSQMQIFARDKYKNSYGYFTDNIQNYSNLNKCGYGKLITIGNSDIPYKRGNGKYFRFFLPESVVKKEKKFRPYTFKEFTDILTVGSIITFRRKAYAELIHNVMFIGYREDEEGLILLLGNAGYSLGELFNEYEYKNSLGKWVPFGVEE